MKTVYGPVPSWRLGKSLGIDVISVQKICSFDCVYCQLGKKDEKTVKRARFVNVERIKEDLSEALDALKGSDVDIITFSGMGEPTLASNLCEAIEVVRAITDLPLAILTNSSLLHLKEVRSTLKKIDKVVAKLDAPNAEIFQSINRPHTSLSIDRIITGIKELRKAYEGEFELQMMFITENKRNAEELASLAVEIDPDRVEINTPLRGCPVKPLSTAELRGINRLFKKKGLDTVSVYEARKPEVKSVNYEETSKRRPE
jgi:wyosine [tRNA(Phe)-imidazoG37] synthetase (radical SAM superfamily)